MKKVLSLLLSMIMICSLAAGIDFEAAAAGNSISTATSISLGTTYQGYINDSNTSDVYRFILPSSGRICLNVTAYIYETDYYIYDSNGKMVWECTYLYWNDTTEVAKINTNVDLIKGTYYFAVNKHNGNGNYNFNISFTSANESFTDSLDTSNNTMAKASSISIGTNYVGQIANNDSSDIYKFTLSTSGRLGVNITAYIYETDYYIYDSNGRMVWECTYLYWNDTTEVARVNTNVDLTKGTYYFAVNQHGGTGNYNFKFTFTSANETFTETLDGTNNTITTANNIYIGNTYKGQLANNDSKDIYKLVLSAPRKININITAYIYETDYYIYDSNGNEVWEKSYVYWNGTTEVAQINDNVMLSSGTYYFAVNQHGGTGNYTFTLNCGHTWNGGTTTKAPTCLKEGERTYKCTACGKTKTEVIPAQGHTVVIDKAIDPGYTKTGKTEGSHCSACGVVLVKQETVAKKKLKKPEIKSLTKGKKAFTVKWKKISSATGYEIKYSTDKNFKKDNKTVKIKDNKTVSKTIKNLKRNKKYYVTIRAYRETKNGTAYSSWSKVQTVKTKK